MTTEQSVRTGPSAGTDFESVDPATGSVIATFPVHDLGEVRARVTCAREAALWWRGLGFAGRRARLLAWRDDIASRSVELADLVHRENGKPADDAYLVEITATLAHLDWAARHARTVLRLRRAARNPLLPHVAGEFAYEPLGVVGVIGPWNYPVFTPMGSLIYALAAGNAVVFKPSEFTPAIGAWLVDSFARVVPEHPVLQLITGFGETGAALCRAGVDGIAFTGSPATGRKVLAACAEALIPAVVELGGKDAMLVAADADVPRAARAAVWGAMSNGGQTCTGIERVYVHAEVYDRFVAEACTVAETVRAGLHYGPATMPAQLDTVRRHVADALGRGARLLVGDPDPVIPAGHGTGGWARPTVLTGVPDDADLLTTETFGPVLPIVRVATMAEAVGLANDSRYGLGASVWSRTEGRAIARELRTGMVAVNSVITFAALPELPFGGIGESGVGRIHGADGLRAFTRAKSYAVATSAPLLDPMDFDRPRWLVPALRHLDRLRLRVLPRRAGS